MKYALKKNGKYLAKSGNMTVDVYNAALYTRSEAEFELTECGRSDDGFELVDIMMVEVNFGPSEIGAVTAYEAEKRWNS